jgi:hypothetical protein
MIVLVIVTCLRGGEPIVWPYLGTESSSEKKGPAQRPKSVLTNLAASSLAGAGRGGHQLRADFFQFSRCVILFGNLLLG